MANKPCNYAPNYCHSHSWSPGQNSWEGEPIENIIKKKEKNIFFHVSFSFCLVNVNVEIGSVGSLLTEKVGKESFYHVFNMVSPGLRKMSVIKY